MKNAIFFQATCLELVKTIREYESDTFSSCGFELTDDEAVGLAGLLIRDLVYKDKVNLDGVTLDHNLAKIRGL
jgi:hypothetical protein